MEDVMHFEQVNFVERPIDVLKFRSNLAGIIVRWSI